MIDGDDDIALGCLGPGSLLVLGKVMLFAVFFYAVLSTLGLRGD